MDTVISAIILAIPPLLVALGISSRKLSRQMRTGNGLRIGMMVTDILRRVERTEKKIDEHIKEGHRNGN